MNYNRKAAACTACIVTGVGLMLASAGPAMAEIASFYSEELRGSPTASGTPFNPDSLTAAHPSLPLGSRVKVCHEDCAEVLVNDRGPFVGGRDIDLSRAAAEAVGLDGVGSVKLERVDSPTPTKEAPEPPKELPKTGGPEVSAR